MATPANQTAPVHDNAPRQWNEGNPAAPVFTLRASPFRGHLESLLDSATQELLVASPYIKTREAEWVCNRLAKHGHDKHVRLQVLTDVRSSNVLGAVLT